MQFESKEGTNEQASERTNACTHTHIHARTRARTHACIRARARTHACRHARTHTRTQARMGGRLSQARHEKSREEGGLSTNKRSKHKRQTNKRSQNKSKIKPKRSQNRSQIGSGASRAPPGRSGASCGAAGTPRETTGSRHKLAKDTQVDGDSTPNRARSIQKGAWASSSGPFRTIFLVNRSHDAPETISERF